ncbi:hypothetical protein AB0395_40080 [Streptosporangium sp. NPDC051023]|uniref:hypothetical protein n=1 Tax=Streptosporangium sp. NPDC051023 TaxID=3155410 RepID=UPI003450BE0B
MNALLPRVDLPEVLLEVFAWTGADAAFTTITGGEVRLADLSVTIAALLVAHGAAATVVAREVARAVLLGGWHPR